MNDSVDDVWFFVAVIAVIIVFALGLVFGVMLGKETLAHDVCVTYGYDTGKYTQGEILCGYDYAVPDELAPIVGGE